LSGGEGIGINHQWEQAALWFDVNGVLDQKAPKWRSLIKREIFDSQL
jgi:hypothetical protein